MPAGDVSSGISNLSVQMATLSPLSSSSLTSYLASCLEHAPGQGVELSVVLNGGPFEGGVRESEIGALCARRLHDAGIEVVPGEEEPGFLLAVEIDVDPDRICSVHMRFQRVTESGTGRARGEGTEGAWRMTIFSRVSDVREVRAHLAALLQEFVRQYLEAN